MKLGFFRLFLVLLMSLAFAACSKGTKEKQDGVFEGDDVPIVEDGQASDAGTDAVPAEAQEDIGEDMATAAPESDEEADDEDEEEDKEAAEKRAEAEAKEKEEQKKLQAEEQKAAADAEASISDFTDTQEEVPSEKIAEQAAPAAEDASPPAEAPTAKAEFTPPVSTDDTPTDDVSEDRTPSPAKATFSSGSGDIEQYVIQKGDTLMKIAFEYYGDVTEWKKIWKDNQALLRDPNVIRVGQTIKVEKPANPPNISRNGDQYLIKDGDNLASISKDVYGTVVKWKKIWKNNELLIRNPNKIYSGFYVYYVLTPEDQQERQNFENGRVPTGK